MMTKVENIQKISIKQSLRGSKVNSGANSPKEEKKFHVKSNSSRLSNNWVSAQNSIEDHRPAVLVIEDNNHDINMNGLNSNDFIREL